MSGACRRCGCTEHRACVVDTVGGRVETCHWVEEDLCSACVPAPDLETRLELACQLLTTPDIDPQEVIDLLGRTLQELSPRMICAQLLDQVERHLVELADVAPAHVWADWADGDDPEADAPLQCIAEIVCTEADHERIVAAMEDAGWQLLGWQDMDHASAEPAVCLRLLGPVVEAAAGATTEDTEVQS